MINDNIKILGGISFQCDAVGCEGEIVAMGSFREAIDHIKHNGWSIIPGKHEDEGKWYHYCAEHSDRSRGLRKLLG